MTQLLQEMTLESTEALNRRDSSGEISVITEFPHDWSIIGPRFEPIVLAHRALAFHAKTHPAELTPLHSDLYERLDTLIYAPPESEPSNFEVLSEDARAVLGACVKELADQQPAILDLTKDFTNFAGFVAIARLYDGRITPPPTDNQAQLPIF